MWVLYQGELFHSRHGFAEPSLISMAEDHHCPWIGSCQTPKTSNGMERGANTRSIHRKKISFSVQRIPQRMNADHIRSEHMYLVQLAYEAQSSQNFLFGALDGTTAGVGWRNHKYFLLLNWLGPDASADFPDCFMAMSCFMVTTWCTRL